jgi:hypothetical protein
LIETAETTDACQRNGMVRTQCLLTARQRPFIQRLGLVITTCDRIWAAGNQP